MAERRLTPSSDTHTRSLAKAVSWRAVGSMDTVFLSWLITGNVRIALTIGGVEVVTKTILYWAHEQVWARVPWGRR